MENKAIFIVTGMDRSGTSWVAGGLQASGVFMGERLFKANRGNPFGYFEDEAFLDFHKKLLHAVHLEGLHQYNLADIQTKISVSEAAEQEARRLIEQRSDYPLWGFKDPRAVLFLDFWRRLIPEAKIICLYRSPLETLLSLFSRGDGFVDLADVFRAFQHRMGQALAFKQRHPQQMMLCNIHQVIARPRRFARLLEAQFDLQLPALADNLAQQFVAEAFSELSLSVETLVNFCHYFPEIAALFEALEAVAEMPGDGVAERETARKKAETCRPPALDEPAELENYRQAFFVSLVEEGLAATQMKQKIIEGFLASVKIMGGVQYEHARLQAQVAALTGEVEALKLERSGLQHEIEAYEHLLQSQDLLTRRFVTLSLDNLKAIFRQPDLITAKFRRWYRARIKREPLMDDELSQIEKVS